MENFRIALISNVMKLSNKAILHFFLHWLDCIDIRKNVLKEISSTDYSNIYLTDAKLIEVFFS